MTLGPRFEILARVGNGRALVEETRKLMPALVVSDITMPEMSGIEAARLITETCPGVNDHVDALGVGQTQDRFRRAP